ncbi:MAG: calcium-binding protein [Cyanobacteria bacterium P01_A01_bin.135]
MAETIFSKEFRGTNGNDTKIASKTGVGFFKKWLSWRMYGYDGNDTLQGGEKDDGLYGYSGSDRLYGLGGNDKLYGHDGNDHLDGGSGNDRLDGGAGADTMIGYSGNDIYHIDNVGDRILYETQGHDIAHVKNVDRYRLPTGVEDMTVGGGNVRTAYGNDQDNAIYTTSAQGQSVYTYGQNGNDTLIGSYGSDVLVGGNGNDKLVGARPSRTGVERDLLYGGYGADDFYLFSEGFYSGNQYAISHQDYGRGSYGVIKDFSASQGDTIHLRSGRRYTFSTETIRGLGSSARTDVAIYDSSSGLIGYVQDTSRTDVVNSVVFENSPSRFGRFF